MNLAEAFSQFSSSAFRLEGLPEYKVEEEAEALAYYERTGRLPQDFNADWLAFLRRSVEAGKRVERLRLLSEPPTPYERIELEAYPRSIESGEVVHAAARSAFPYLSDFWFFDDRLIANMRYAEDGSFLGADVHECTPAELDYVHEWYERFERAISVPLTPR